MKTNDTHPIMCGTDFSENAARAADVGAALAEPAGHAQRAGIFRKAPH